MDAKDPVHGVDELFLNGLIGGSTVPAHVNANMTAATKSLCLLMEVLSLDPHQLQPTPVRVSYSWLR